MTGLQDLLDQLSARGVGVSWARGLPVTSIWEAEHSLLILSLSASQHELTDVCSNRLSEGAP